MKNYAIKKITMFAVIALVICVGILPIIKANVPSIFPEGFSNDSSFKNTKGKNPRFSGGFPEGFRDVDCLGKTCPEGQFCQQNTCHPIYPRGFRLEQQ